MVLKSCLQQVVPQELVKNIAERRFRDRECSCFKLCSHPWYNRQQLNTFLFEQSYSYSSSRIRYTAVDTTFF